MGDNVTSSPMDDLFDEARDLLDDGTPGEALAVLEKIEDQLHEAEEQKEYLYLKAAALMELGEIETARQHLEQALVLGDDVELRSLEAHLHLAAGRYKLALRAAEKAVHLDPEDAGAQHTRAVVLTFLGRLEDADRAFARAGELAPEDYFRPYRLSRRDFDGAVEEVLFSLPEVFRRHLENVEIAVADIPLDDESSHELLGIYRGQTIHSEGWDFPDQILLFQRNLENVSPDRETLLREIRDTVLHEVGHHLGLDDDELRAIENSWDEK